MGGIHLLTLGSAGGVLAPAGLIVPYTGSTAPANWTMFTAANGRMIVGAGGSYAPTTTGGSTSVSVSGTSASGGAHTAGTFGGVVYYYTSGGGFTQYDGTAGSHTHTFSGSSTAPDVSKSFTLIKCEVASMVPSGGILLGTTELATLTPTETSTDRFIMASSSYGTVAGSSTFAISGTTSSVGSHSHPGSGTSPSEGWHGWYRNMSSGGHSHAFTVTGAINTKRMYLSAWSSAAAFGVQLNGVAMYEGSTAPAGWSVCNGANGTPDLRDFFVRIGNSTNHGTSSGDNVATWSLSASGSATHNHNQDWETNNEGYGSAQHTSTSWSHSHSGSGTVSIVQPYYALTFVKYTG